MKQRIWLYSLLSMLLVAWTSCQHSESLDSPTPPNHNGTLKLRINVPGVQGLPTYAASEIDECEVLTVSVLVFRTDNNKFIYHVEGSNITTGGNTNQKTFNVNIEQTEDPDNVYLLVVANAQACIQAAIGNGTISTAKTANEIMRSLTFSSSGKWAVPPGPFTRFPMWGRSKGIDLTAETITVAPISLVRAIAKIDVGLNFVDNKFAGLGKEFKLESVYVFNAQNQLLVCPDPNHINAEWTTATAPSVPSTATANAQIEYLTNLHNDNPEKIAYTDRIYVAEHAAGSDEDRANNFYLVIGGRFGTSSTEGTATTYYRVDFLKTTRNEAGEVTKQEYLPILRNHHYRVNISKVHNRGYDTVKEAQDAMGLNTNLTVAISDDDGDIKDMVYDGQYMFGVGQSEFLLDKTPRTVELKVSTTYPKGWKATSNASWLTINTPSSNTNGKSIFKFSVAVNTGSTARTGIITFQSGRLFKEVKVTQEAIAHIEFVGLIKENTYPMNNSTYSLRVKSPYAWRAKIDLGNDPSNIVRRGFTPSGSANTTVGAGFNFQLINDELYQAVEKATAKITFYSPTNEFKPTDLTINGAPGFSLHSSLYIYYQDQPINNTWQSYNSQCKTMKSHTSSKPWRLPTDPELRDLIATTSGQAIYNFANNTYYWSSTPYNSNYTYIRLFSNGTVNWASPTITGYRARCVRQK